MKLTSFFLCFRKEIIFRVLMEIMKRGHRVLCTYVKGVLMSKILFDCGKCIFPLQTQGNSKNIKIFFKTKLYIFYFYTIPHAQREDK